MLVSQFHSCEGFFLPIKKKKSDEGMINLFLASSLLNLKKKKKKEEKKPY